LVLAVCSLGLFLVGMDVTIVNVALPAIQQNLGAEFSGLQWVIDAYLLVVASLLLLTGSLSDRLGRRPTFQLGLVIFTLGSFLCSTAPGVRALIAWGTNNPPGAHGGRSAQ
jgi:MFS family permease